MNACKKEIVVVEGTESEFFERAVFFVREQVKERSGGTDIVAEANRIVADLYREAERKSRKKLFDRRFVTGCVSGIAAAVCIFGLLTLIF